MDNKEIIRMAREAGANERWGFDGFDFFPHELERFAALVAAHAKSEQINLAYQQGYEEGSAHEREACAKVCEENGEEWVDGNNDWCSGQVKGSYDCAAAIRARGEK